MGSTNQIERRHVVVLVASLNRFSAPKVAVPERAIDLIDAFFQAMLPQIDSSGGIVVDLVGHQLLVSFDIADDLAASCSSAVDAGLQMQQVFSRLRPGWVECGYDVQMGIGIHHGRVQMEREERGHYSLDIIMGTVVNVARGLAEQTENILVSENTFHQIPSSAHGKLFQASKLWVAAVCDGVVAYQITPPPDAPRLSTESVGEFQILIAEDHADLREIFATVLRRAGFSVNLAANGHEALEFLDRRLPDLLLLDINMPGPSGLEIIRYVRQNQSPVKVIVITANHQAGRSAEAEMADLFLLKPVSITDLVQMAQRFAKMRV